MRNKVIGLTGSPGSGKSEVANYLVTTLGYKRIKFAYPLKAMLTAYYTSQDVPPSEIDRRIEGDLKEAPDPFLGGKTPRHAMQTLGTEWGRHQIGDTFWIDAWRDAVKRCDRPVVVDDCRFENEARAIRKLGGSIIRLLPGVSRRKKSDHQAEQGLGDDFVDTTIKNDGSLGQLFMRVLAELDRL